MVIVMKDLHAPSPNLGLITEDPLDITQVNVVQTSVFRQSCPSVVSFNVNVGKDIESRLQLKKLHMIHKWDLSQQILKLQ